MVRRPFAGCIAVAIALLAPACLFPSLDTLNGKRGADAGGAGDDDDTTDPRPKTPVTTTTTTTTTTDAAAEASSGPTFACPGATVAACKKDAEVCCGSSGTSGASAQCVPAAQSATACPDGFLTCSDASDCPTGQACCFDGQSGGRLSECTAACSPTAIHPCNPINPHCPAGQNCTIPVADGVPICQ